MVGVEGAVKRRYWTFWGKCGVVVPDKIIDTEYTVR